MVFICPECQVENRENAKFCRKCGKSRAMLVTGQDAPQETAAEEKPPETASSAPAKTQDTDAPQCPACWTALRHTDKFCSLCGEPQPYRILPFMKLCLVCDTLLPERANYCFVCGAEVGPNAKRKIRVPQELFKDEQSEFFPRFDA